MTSASSGEHLWIIGTGRMGLALGTLLQSSGIARRLTFSGRRRVAPDHPLFQQGGATVRYLPEIRPPTPAPDGILIAVPDDAIHDVASRLAASHPGRNSTVLHTSGTLGLDVLEPLARRGDSVGSLHPLAAVVGGVEGGERLRGAWFGVEAAGEARELAERIVNGASGHLLEVREGGRPLYHAASVFASNYAVVLLDVAQRLMAEAGVPAHLALDALVSLAAGAVANVAESGTAAALTGPIARGDERTIRLHRARLSGEERELYWLLGRQALRLAREHGLDSTVAERVEAALTDR